MEGRTPTFTANDRRMLYPYAHKLMSPWHTAMGTCGHTTWYMDGHVITLQHGWAARDFSVSILSDLFLICCGENVYDKSLGGQSSVSLTQSPKSPVSLQKAIDIKIQCNDTVAIEIQTCIRCLWAVRKADASMQKRSTDLLSSSPQGSPAHKRQTPV